MGILEVEQLTKRYGKPGRRLGSKEGFSLSLSFTVEEGELLCVIGPSGAGKSTLLSLISGQERIDSGRVILSGRDITREAMQKRNIGMIFQDFALFPTMNVEKNITYGMKHASPSDKKALCKSLLSDVGLPGYEKRSVTTLSGGEAQRVALARACAAKPSVLLLDEPLSALDPPLRKRLRELIRDVNRKQRITMIYVTHDIDEAFSISDRVLIMREGRLVSLGCAEDLYENPPDLFTALFTGDGTVLRLPPRTEGGGGVLFFRPERAKVSETPLDRAAHPGSLILNGAEVVSADYAGSHYALTLRYAGREVRAYSDKKPEGPRVTVSVPRRYVRRFPAM